MNAASPVTSASTPGSAPKTAGHDVAPDLADDLPVALVVLAAGHHVRDQRDRPVVRRTRLVGSPSPSIARIAACRSAMAVCVAGSFALVTTTSSVEVEPSAILVEQVHALDASIESGNEAKSDWPMCRRSAGNGHREQEPAGDDEGDDRPAHDGADDDRPQAAALGPVAAEERDPEPVHAVAEDRQRRRQERQRADDGDEDDRDRPDGHRAEEDVVEQEQAADREHDREAGEEDGSPGRRRRDVDRVAACAPCRRSVRKRVTMNSE